MLLLQLTHNATTLEVVFEFLFPALLHFRDKAASETISNPLRGIGNVLVLPLGECY